MSQRSFIDRPWFERWPGRVDRARATGAAGLRRPAQGTKPVRACKGGAGRGSSLKLTEAAAGDLTADSGGSQGGDRRATGFLGVRAARVKRATGGRVDRRGRVTE